MEGRTARIGRQSPRPGKPGTGYDAFISYSHAADGQLAPALQIGLQRFAKRWTRRRALRVFRDDSGLSVSAALWPAIERALDDSSYFILLASPDAAQSEWVNKEISRWVELGREDRVLSVVTDGEWMWDGAEGDFNWSVSSAVPRALKSVFSQEPRHLDLRWARDDVPRGKLDLRNSDFRSAVADLAAPIHGRPKDELEGQDLREFKKAQWVRRLAIAGLSVLTVALGIATILAVVNSREARRQEAAALANEALAEDRAITLDARRLAALADSRVDEEVDLSLLLALQSLRVRETPEGWASLGTALSQPVAPRSPLVGYEGAVVDVDFNPDGNLLATASTDGNVVIWDVGSGEATAKITASHDTAVVDVEFSPDGEMVASAGSDGSVLMWELLSEELDPKVLQAGGDALDVSISFSPTDDVIAAASWIEPDRSRLTIWDVSSGQLNTAPFELKTDVTDLAYSPDGRALAIGSRSIELWDPLRKDLVGPSLPAADFEWVNAMAFGPDASVLASVAPDGLVRLWDLATGQQGGPPLMGTPSRMWDVAISEDGSLLATAEGQGVRLWDLETRLEIEVFLEGRSVVSIDFSPDGSQLAVGTDERTVILLDLIPGMALGTLDDYGELEFMSHSRDLAVRSEGSVRIWDLAEFQAVRTIENLDPLALKPGSAAVSSVLGLMARAEDDEIEFYDQATGEQLGESLVGHTDIIRSLAFSPDGGVLASGGDDETVRLWNVAKRRAIGGPLPGHLDSVLDLAFSPDGEMLISASEDNTLRRWNVASHEPLGEPMAGHLDDVEAVLFSPDGALVASAGGFDRTVRLWDTLGQPIGVPLAGLGSWPETGWVGHLAFSVDGRILASSDLEGGRRSLGEGVVRLWAGPSAWQERACEIAGRDLTQAEWTEHISIDRPFERTCQSGGQTNAP